MATTSIAAALALALAPSAYAAEAAEQGIVDVGLPALLAPMIVGPRLESYAYIIIVLAPTGANKVLLIREKVPFLRDAFLRELNKGTIVKAADTKAVDAEAIKTRLTARMNQVLPAGTVAELKLEQIVVIPVQPGS
ncbi:MAG: hypothetical protein EXR00_07025 [Alphaproteobacteria bacterium]|nr:hypothetical protein [Alphaproteobacteria bacterium]